MEIDPRRLRFLLAVARAGGVLAAADELRVTPSAVSQQLGRLEKEVGRSLLRRTAHGTVLTEAGRVLAEGAEEVERALAESRAKLLSSEEDVAGTVRIGGFASFLAAVLVPEVAGWRERYPQLHLEIVELEQDQLLKALRNGELDAVVLELDAGEASRVLPARMTETPLLDEPWKLVVPAGTVPTGESVDLSRLSLPWLGVEPTAAGARALQRVRRATGSALPTVHTYLATQTALALVAAGEGVALIPSLALLGASHNGFEALEVPGLGSRRVVLRRYEGRGVPRTVDVITGLVRDAASAFSFSAEV
jgi:DNA-binding transcriptional LysR family regulator